jgi:phenylalanine-4-hydroxylase
VSVWLEDATVTEQAGSTLDHSGRVPAHLRRFVVEQEYSAYTAVDRAVWRFLLLQVRARLIDTAHPAYREGLAATGISPDHIPNIREMNDRLSHFGWGAVCVDGFIPPRAFQEFQANGLLPIAAEVRTREHLVYTPAPDVFHEAAGHAPILPDPVYAAYLKRIGDLGRKAFTVPEEHALDEAIHALSTIKEDPAVPPAEVARAEAALAAITRALPAPSEAARLSRLYWWTAEYGLVGRPDDYQLYGAGLLSSLGESHSCHAPEVRKLPLDIACMDQPYDITRPQPQLFVAPSFEALHDILDQATADVAVTLGGAQALQRALGARELATVTFTSGAAVIGVLTGVGPAPDAPAWLELSGPTAFARNGLIPTAPDDPFGLCRGEDTLVVCGRLSDGREPSELDDRRLDELTRDGGGRTPLPFASGATVEGVVRRRARAGAGRLLALELSDARLSLPGRADEVRPRFVLLAVGDIAGAHAGAQDARFHPDTKFSAVRVPKARAWPEQDAQMLRLYQQAERAHNRGASAMALEFPRVHEALRRQAPQEWLLRWNLLESLLRVGIDLPLIEQLRGELEHLEVAFAHRQPITSGLRYLEGRTG